MNIKITGTGSYIPSKIEKNEDFHNHEFLNSDGSSIKAPAEVIVKKINEFDFVIKQDETAVYASGFGDSSVNLLVWFWINYPGEADFMTVRHKAIVAVKQALAEADISIPFPIRTLDFGIKGGEKLDAMISDKQNDD